MTRLLTLWFCTLTLLWPRPALAAGGWAFRVPITVVNRSADDVAGYQMRLELNLTSGVFVGAQRDLRDLRFADGDGARYLPHWVQSNDGAKAVVWVRLAQLSAFGTATIYAYAGNPNAADLSSGFRTFDFFDDFGEGGAGYFALGEPATIAVRDQAWETQAPHTLSVVALNRDGYRYWGYYGLADCGGIGLLRSNDLKRWDKAPQAVLRGDGERWPSVLEAGGRVTMVYDRDHCGISHVVMRSSLDGVMFDAEPLVLVRQEAGVRNQNPHLFHNPADGRYYLYWFRGGEAQGYWQIKARSALTPEGLADASSDRVLLEEPYTLAAPNMLWHDGVFYLSTEVNENAWKTKIYAGPTAFGPFKPLPGAIVLSNNEACWFQHPIEGALHGYFCKDTRGDGSGWVLQHRVGDLNRRLTERALDGTFWTVVGGEWRIDALRDGGVLRGTPGAIARVNIPVGTGKIAEADGGTLRLTGDHVDVVADDGPIDNVRIRKVFESAPEARVGTPERRVPGRAWFVVGEGAHGGASGALPQTGLDNLIGLFGALAVATVGFFAAWVAEKAQLGRKKAP